MRAVAPIAIACLALATLAPRASAQQRAVIPIQYDRAQISDVLAQLAPRLGERFIYDASLTGQITIRVPRPVSKNEAWQLLHAALAMKGFAALPIPAGGYKIVPLAAAGDSDPWTLEAPSPEGENRILTLLPLRNVAVADVLLVIRPLLAATTIAMPLESTNSLLLATTERRVAAIQELLQGLDVRDAIEPRLRTLYARDVASVLQAIEARYPRSEGRRHRVVAWADERTNTLIYRAPADERPVIEAMIDELDRPIRGSGTIAVLPLRHAEAEVVASQIDAFAREDATGPSGQRSPLAGTGLAAVADPATQSIVLRGSPEAIALAGEVAAQLDRPPKQVAVEVTVQEWSYESGFELAIAGVAAAGSIDADPGTGALTGEGAVFLLDPLSFGTSSVIPDQAVVRATNLPFQIDVIASLAEVDSVTLLQPSLVLMSGEEHSIFRGNNVPVPTNPPDGSNDVSLTQSVAIERRDVGIDLTLRATVGDTSAARLEVTLDIENLRSSLTDAEAAGAGPTFTVRNVQGTVELLPGQALLIAGATQAFVERTRVGIPFLMDIPWLGVLFSGTRERDRRSRIIVAIQAEALPDSESLAHYSARRRLAFERMRAIGSSLGGEDETQFALRIGTERSLLAAESLARTHATERHPSRILQWDDEGGDYYDVHLVGYEDFLSAADDAYRLNASGLRTDVLPLGSAKETLH